MVPEETKMTRPLESLTAALAVLAASRGD